MEQLSDYEPPCLRISLMGVSGVISKWIRLLGNLGKGAWKTYTRSLRAKLPPLSFGILPSRYRVLPRKMDNLRAAMRNKGCSRKKCLDIIPGTDTLSHRDIRERIAGFLFASYEEDAEIRDPTTLETLMGCGGDVSTPLRSLCAHIASNYDIKNHSQRSL